MRSFSRYLADEDREDRESQLQELDQSLNHTIKRLYNDVSCRQVFLRVACDLAELELLYEQGHITAALKKVTALRTQIQEALDQ